MCKIVGSCYLARDLSLVLCDDLEEWKVGWKGRGHMCAYD